MADDNDQGAHELKTIEIIVNGTQREVTGKDELSFEDVVLLAFPDETSPDDKYTVTFEASNHNKKPDGILSVGEHIAIKKDTIFVVSATGQS